MVMPVEYGQLLRREREIQAEPNFETKACDDVSHEKKKREPSVDDVEDSVLDEDEILKRREKLDKLRGFMKYKRKTDPYRNAKKRLGDWKEVNVRLSRSELHTQAARCMDCGVPFCQSETGCPIGNIIPKWNELVYKDDWKAALDRLMMTNNFPEFTGRVW
jgi:glutamate synthase (NADPH/NADH)